MKQSSLEYLVGGFVLLGLTAICYLAIKLGGGSLIGSDSYSLEARFDNASGLNVGGSVHLAGVPMGRIEGIRIDPSDFSAIVTMSVPAGLNLPTDSMASIKTSGLIGDKFISISPGADTTNLQPGARITMTESSVDIESLISKMAFGSIDKNESSEKEQTPVP